VLASARMRAGFFEAAGTITVREAPVPEPGPDEVRLRVSCCGICGSDLSVYKTGALAGPHVILGHELSAAVDLDPSGRWVAGTRVAVYPHRGCGACLWCLEGEPRYCLNPPPGAGGFAEYLVVPAANLIPLPDQIDDRAGALCEPLGVAVRAVEMAEAKPGDVAYVSGLGSLGLLAVAALAASGCRVIGSDPREDRRSLAFHLGCEDAFDNTREDTVTRTLALDPKGPRIALECAGVPDSLQQVFDTAGYAGVVGILGVPMAPIFLLRMTLRELTAFSVRGPTLDSMRLAVNLLRERPDIARVITGVVSLADTNEAFSRLVAGTGGIKVLVEPRA